MKKRNKKIKLKFKNIFKLIVILIIVIIYFKNNYKVKSVDIDNNQFIIKLNKKNLECILSNEEPTLESDWIKSDKRICTLEYKKGVYNLYIKKNNKIVNLSKRKVIYIDKINTDKLYIANNSKERYFNVIIGKVKKLRFKSNNDDIAYIDDDGYVIAKNSGNVKLSYKYNSIVNEINVISTNLITERSKEFDFNKDVISCKKYNQEESELLDEIIKSKIENVGYKTRAGVVEAARFLTLDFPYKIPYFYENGRQTTNRVDGEGRYYHEGLYLSKDKYKDLTGSTSSPSYWGCPLYSEPIDETVKNGLDCSGFVSWAILNGGFDIKDVGAGFKDGEYNDLTDYGDLKKLSSSTLLNNKIKVGDLLHSLHSGGHIAMIIGIDENYYYVAQALWSSASNTLTNRKNNDHSVQITKYTKNELIKAFSEIVLMDKYYSKDGDLTDMWY